MIDIEYSFSLRQEDWISEDLNQWAETVEQTVDLPTSLIKDVTSTRKNTVFLKCPAHTDFLKNTFVFKSPIDISLHIDVSDNVAKIWSNNLDQRIFEKLIDGRFLTKEESGNNQHPIIGIDFLNYFTADASTLLTVTPAYFHYNDFTNKTTIIPGEFDISKWSRPIECVFEVKQNIESIEIKKGDAICYFKFRSLSDIPIKMCKSDMPWRLIDHCAELRSQNPFRPLKCRYESLEENPFVSKEKKLGSNVNI